MLRSSYRLLCLFAIAVFGCNISALAQDADSGWEICNKTSFVLETAIARPENEILIVEGWTKLRPGSCEQVVTSPLITGEDARYYLYAYSSPAHRGGRREWRGETPLCVDTSGGFSTENPNNCENWGLVSRLFKPVEMENSTYFRTDLTETTEFTLSQARNAGVQRLLEDAGIYSDEIDGDMGPVTQYAIREFLASNQLDVTTSDEDLLDMLEQVGQQRALNVGMQVCNRTEHKIWAAIASRKGDGWESRGWWGLEAGGCARVIDKLLQETRYFVLGEIETDQGVRQLRRATDNFCVGRARFAINGRENCEARAFRTAPFVNIPTPESRQLVYEFFERDFTDPEPR